MTPGKVDLPVPGEMFYRGDPFTQTFRFKIGTVPEDLTGITFRAQIRKNADAAAIVASFDVTDGSSSGEVTISMTAADTAALPRTGVWDLQGSDDITRIYGAITVTEDVTR